MPQPEIPAACPACGHATVQCVAGLCSVFVPTPDGPRHADYCGCDCYAAITGRDLLAEFAAALNPDTED